jgi:hypothetical protein
MANCASGASHKEGNTYAFISISHFFPHLKMLQNIGLPLADAQISALNISTRNI